MDDDFVGWAVALVFVFVAFAFVITGVVWLMATFWWVFLLIGLPVVAWLIYRHPGVRAKREVKAAVKRGNQLRGDIRTATEHTKAEMERIAQDWKRWEA